MDTSMHDISNLNLIYPRYIFLDVSIMDICLVVHPKIKTDILEERYIQKKYIFNKNI